METLVLTCILAITTPSGQICIKSDGHVAIPAGIELDRLSRQFWEETARVYKLIKDERCL